MTWSPKPENMWRDSAALQEARSLPGWREFHRVCGQRRLFFDHIEKVGREYVCVAFTGSGTETSKLCEVSGKSVIEALEAAYRAARLPVAEAEIQLALMKGDNLIGGPVAVDDFEDLIG